MRTRLRSIGLAAGLELVGFASAAPFPEVEAELWNRKRTQLSHRLGFTYSDPAAATDLTRHFSWARTLVVGARSYRPSRSSAGAAAADPREGRVAAAARLPGYGPLLSGLSAVAAALSAAGHRAEVLSDDNRLVDRAAAVRAGLGWWGKNSMVLAPGFGPWILLGSVVTDLFLEPDAPLERTCGACAACLPACPTGALIAPGVLDARRCLAAWAQTPGLIPFEFRDAMGNRLYGCDDCLDACPPGRALRAKGSDEGLRFDLRWVLYAADQTLLKQFGHWFLPNRDPRIIRRNALIAAGNSASAELVASVTPYTRHPDWLLRAHAVWALRKLGGAEAGAALAALVVQEADERVLQELDRPPIGK